MTSEFRYWSTVCIGACGGEVRFCKVFRGPGGQFGELLGNFGEAVVVTAAIVVVGMLSNGLGKG